MAMYVTKVWGFDVPVGPLQFSTQGWRNRAREFLKPGDLVVLVGTKGEETTPEERGRILGMMEPTKEVALWLDFNLPTRAVDFDEQNNYRWPYALLNRAAWRFRNGPPLDKISSRKFNMNAAQGLVELTETEAAKILALPREEAPLLAPVRVVARLDGQEAARRKTAPPPTTARLGIMHLRRAAAFTYAMQIAGADVQSFKVGWAFDYKIRQRQFNQASLPALGGLNYQPKLFHLWSTAREAFSMEQALLRRFDSCRHPANHEVLSGVSEAQLRDAWAAFLHPPRT